MKLRQPETDTLENLNIDFFIVSSGFESRVTTQAVKYSRFAKEKIALAFNSEMDDPIRIENDHTLSMLGFSLSVVDGEELTNLKLNQIVNQIDEYAKVNDNAIVYIDYSSMTRNWYSYLLYGFFNSINKERIKLFFGYSHAEFVASDENHTLNRIVSPLFGY